MSYLCIFTYLTRSKRASKGRRRVLSFSDKMVTQSSTNLNWNITVTALEYEEVCLKHMFYLLKSHMTLKVILVLLCVLLLHTWKLNLCGVFGLCMELLFCKDELSLTAEISCFPISYVFSSKPNPRETIFS